MFGIGTHKSHMSWNKKLHTTSVSCVRHNNKLHRMIVMTSQRMVVDSAQSLRKLLFTTSKCKQYQWNDLDLWNKKVGLLQHLSVTSMGWSQLKEIRYESNLYKELTCNIWSQFIPEMKFVIWVPRESEVEDKRMRCLRFVRSSTRNTLEKKQVVAPKRLISLQETFMPI